jgi:hypothetical protein
MLYEQYHFFVNWLNSLIQDEELQLGTLITLSFASFTTILRTSVGMLNLMTLHCLLLMANWARVCASWLPSLLTWLKQQSGSNRLSSFISVMIPSQLACCQSKPIVGCRQVTREPGGPEPLSVGPVAHTHPDVEVHWACHLTYTWSERCLMCFS